MSYVLRNADFVQTPARNLVLDRRSAGPDHAVDGQLIFNTTLNEAQVFKNGSWQSIGGSPVPEGETIWHSGNDGAGSGLDADTVDGNHASAFATSDHSHAWSAITSKPANSQFPNTAEAIGASKNLNNYTTPGFYYQNANANASNGSNYPVARAGTLIVTKDAGTTQMYYEYNGSGVYYRTFYSSTWTAWQNLVAPKWANVSSKPAQATRWPTWSEVTSKPSTFAPSSHTHSYLPLAGGTMTGVLYPQRNTSYTTGQARRIIMSTAAPSGGGNGDVWLRYV